MAKRKKKLPKKYRNRRIAFVAIAALLIAALAWGAARALKIDTVEVTGTKVVPKNTVRAVAEEAVGTSYPRIDKKRMENRIAQNAYVKEVHIGYGFFGKLKVDIREETPFAQIYTDDGYVLVNEEFKALEKTRSYDPNLPKISGMPTKAIKIGHTVFDGTKNEKKIEMIRGLFQSAVAESINSVDILDRGIKILLSDGTAVHIRSFEDGPYKIRQLEEIYKEMKAKNSRYSEIYLDQGDHPVAVKPSALEDDEDDTQREQSEQNKPSETTKSARDTEEKTTSKETRKTESDGAEEDAQKARATQNGNS